MHAVPDPQEVREFAATLGMTLSTSEAELYTARLAEHLVDMDEFVQNRWEETAPPRYPGAREPGYKPSAEEDSHNAWMWKCEIQGSGEGLLAGKTVSFKDHTAVAGVPLTFGSFPFEGFIPDFDATVVSRVLEAGATVTGKNVMNGLTGGFGFGGGIGDYGRPLNPHNPDHVSGGSSSGSAVALALNEVDISFGGDQGGSIRIPPPGRAPSDTSRHSAWCRTSVSASAPSRASTTPARWPATSRTPQPHCRQWPATTVSTHARRSPSPTRSTFSAPWRTA